MALAYVTAARSTCVRRSVGCVLLNERGHVLATGNNGVAKGRPHCNEGHTCVGFDLPPGQDNCEALHAEVNALMQCRDHQAVDTAYVTLSPCLACAKILLNTPCRRIVFLREFENTTARLLWERAGRAWHKISLSPDWLVEL